MINNNSLPFILNDHLFLQGIVCPLRLIFLQANSNLSGSRPVYRQRNKLHLRNALSKQFGDRRYTSDHVIEAEKETKLWLTRENVTICGAVIMAGEVLTRIPILYKNGNEFTIVQVHGKLRKESQRNALAEPGKNRSTSLDLLKAAYRKEILLRKFPKAVAHNHFYYPRRDFMATVDGLHRFVNSSGEHSKDADENFKNLFLKIDASVATEHVRNRMPENLAHQKFAGLSLERVIDILIMQSKKGTESAINLDRHEGCSRCDFRHSGIDEPGCWESFFQSGFVHNPAQHTYDLIGHGNRQLTEHGWFYQEQVDISDGFHSFGTIQSYGGQNITIQQRRNLQILSAKEEVVPTVWIKNNIYKLLNLTYPLHFIDFEAATYAIPMRRGTSPYDPVYFQFSCHTLYSDQTIEHTEWLTKQALSEQIHSQFVTELSQIPDIFQGTVIQYSPFEKQALNRLMNEFRLNSMRFDTELGIVRKLIDGELPPNQKRFIDVSEIIKNSYFNCEMSGSLGLKELLKSVIRVETNQLKKLSLNVEKSVAGFKEDLLNEFSKESNPYEVIQENNSSITDGSAAMHAWIAMNNGLLSEKESNLIPEILMKYCKLDSLSMVFLYVHLLQFLKKDDGNDIIIF